MKNFSIKLSVTRCSAAVIPAWLAALGAVCAAETTHTTDVAPPTTTTSTSTARPVDAGELSRIVVEASADASAGGLPPAYAGGQVARGARVGVLGTRDAMDTPFSVVSYTNQLIQDQQARSVAAVLQNEPTVRMGRGFGNFAEVYFIRGFLTGASDVAYNGLYGMLPRQYTSIEMAERIELVRGAAAFLYGAAPSGWGIGGTINVLPKRAADQDLNALTLGSASGGALYTAADFSRRLGDTKQWGLRLNLARRHGDTALPRESSKLGLATLGLDWRGDGVRLSADLGWQDNQLRGPRPNVSLGNITTLPAAPDNKVNFAQPWTRSNERDIFGTVRGEVDLNDASTAWIAAGLRDGHEYNTLAGMTLTNGITGAGTAYRFDNRRRDEVRTGEVGLRHAVRTGAIAHEIVLSAAHYDHKAHNAVTMDLGNPFPNNIYNPNIVARPVFTNPAFVGGNINNRKPNLSWRQRMTSFTLGDTLSLFDGHLNAVVGLRYQRLQYATFNYAGVANSRPYDDSRVSPALGVVYKISPRVSAYANFIESLARGDTAPLTSGGQPVLNGGQMLAPFVSSQKEVGLKYDGGKLGAGLALFTTEKPHAFVNSNRVFAESGKDRHSGAELTFYGQPWRSVRVLGGATFLDAKQRSTGVAARDGRRVIGVPARQATLGVEWDVAPEWTLTARTVATGSRYANSANTLRVPGQVRYDAGARYTLDLPGDQILTLRVQVENLFNRSDWVTVGGWPNQGHLALGLPRTLSVNATWEF